jgi:hypothetical protein
MQLRSPSGICSASANGSAEVIQEFVVCESRRNLHCQLDWAPSVATSSPFSHTCLYRLPFPAGHSAKIERNRSAMDPDLVDVFYYFEATHLLVEARQHTYRCRLI